MIATSNIAIERTASEGGFTLIELLVVLSIIALLSATALSSFSRNARWRGRHEVARVLDAASTARTQAIRTGRAVALGTDAIPGDTRFVTPEGQPPLWFPDGTARAAQLRRGDRILVKVDPATGLGREAP